MKSQDVFAALYIIVVVAIIIGIVYLLVTGQYETLWYLIVAAVAVIIVVTLAVYLVLGTFHFFKSKDKVHEDSGMALEDVKEVDREMEEK